MEYLQWVSGLNIYSREVHHEVDQIRVVACLFAWFHCYRQRVGRSGSLAWPRSLARRRIYWRAPVLVWRTCGLSILLPTAAGRGPGTTGLFRTAKKFSAEFLVFLHKSTGLLSVRKTVLVRLDSSAAATFSRQLIQDAIMHNVIRYSPLFAVILLGACTTMPPGPSVMALPGSGKNFDQFRADDYSCRQYAQQQLNGVTPDQAAVDSGVRSAAVGTLVGAAIGAAVNGSRGAAVGAGTGLMFGSLSGAGAANSAGYGTQRRYDFAYQQCMYAQGHQISGPQRYRREPPPARTYGEYYPPPPNAPPPPGY